MISLWEDSVKAQRPALRPALRGVHKADVLIIGAGMAGVLAAYRLKEAGIHCVTVEARTVGCGVTKGTTGKITAQHGLLYQKLIKECGIENSIRYHEINTAAIREFESLCEIYPSDLNKQTAYVYTLDNPRKLEMEAQAYTRLGIKPLMIDDPKLPIKTMGAIGMKDQACFNPLKFLYALAEQLDIHENTLITDVRGNKAFTHSGSIEADHIVFCSHYPMVNLAGGYVFKLYQDRSYITTLKNASPVHGMFIDEKDEGLSFRMAGPLLLICGGDHRTGRSRDGLPHLRQFAAQAYPDATEVYAWGAQDTMPLDSRPYIGRFSDKHKNWYVACGFRKWGMSGSMVAARVLTELIVSGKSDYETLFDPSRSVWHPQLLVNGLSSAAGLLQWGGPRCTHLGCRLVFNNVEQTWECPCHGSRFDSDGKVEDNPAIKHLKDTEKSHT